MIPMPRMPRVSQEAINRLGELMRANNSHGAYTLNRLKNEDRRYAAVADSFLTNIPTMKSKEEMQEFVRNVIAACYHVVELSFQYPDKAQLHADVLLADPLQDSNSAAIISAEQETIEILQQCMLHAEK